MAKKDSELLKEAGLGALGLAVGTALGMLFSPKSGKKNREALIKETKKAVKKVQTAEKKPVKPVVKKAKKVAAKAKKK